MGPTIDILDCANAEAGTQPGQAELPISLVLAGPFPADLTTARPPLAASHKQEAVRQCSVGLAMPSDLMLAQPSPQLQSIATSAQMMSASPQRTWMVPPPQQLLPQQLASGTADPFRLAAGDKGPRSRKHRHAGSASAGQHARSIDTKGIKRQRQSLAASVADPIAEPGPLAKRSEELPEASLQVAPMSEGGKLQGKMVAIVSYHQCDQPRSSCLHGACMHGATLLCDSGLYKVLCTLVLTTKLCLLCLLCYMFCSYGLQNCAIVTFSHRHMLS